MRRITMFIAVSLLVTSLTAPATASSLRTYLGHTSQGRRITFEVRRSDSGVFFLRSYYLKVQMECEDGSTVVWGKGASWGGRGLRLDGRDLDHLDQEKTYVEHVTGRFRPGTAAGTFIWSFTELGGDGPCSSGDLTWTSRRE